MLFSTTLYAICQALQINTQIALHPFSIDALMDIYKNLTFPKKAHTFECFLPENSELPRTNAPYSAFISLRCQDKSFPWLLSY